ncbi:hypothetical protein CTI12_AA169650 [Artemisia annua]|uniref:DUF4283 domain-containing protein n=1 Tax=Artemisia annua TaxID=35608 RepID=A0A2U1PC28_ARTAN|nr:hypothetical protein CTI12_AA169650 [Artemisia annua]
MPTESNKPPDTLIKEFRILTKMTSADGIRVVSVNDAKGRRGRPRKVKKGVKIKVSTPGSVSAGAGSTLKRLRASKVSGKARDRHEVSPMDNRVGKRIITAPVNDEISKVLSDLKSGSINSHLKFAIGSTKSVSYDSTSVTTDKDDCNGNDGSFIKLPLDKCPSNNQSESVAKSSGLKNCPENNDMVGDGNISCNKDSSKDGITSAKTDKNVCGIEGPNSGSEHTGMDGVVNTGAVSPTVLDGIADGKDGNSMDFEFGNNDKSRGILKKPIGPFFNVQFGKINGANPFLKKPVGVNSKSRNDTNGKGFAATMLSNQFSADVDRFAEKLKQGSEELALKMEYFPNLVTKLENGNKRIEFSVEELVRGGQAFALQLYGYFVGTSMDYRVVYDNLMKMWRVYGIEDITKTSSGIFYFKFKNEEGMKTVLDSGPWMVQNVPFVLNFWKPGIWLDKT